MREQQIEKHEKLKANTKYNHLPLVPVMQSGDCGGWKDMTYILYATTENGDGAVREVGRYDDLDEISIVVRMFAKDVVISIEKETEKE